MTTRKPRGLPLTQWYLSLNEEDRARVSRACLELMEQSLALGPDWYKVAKPRPQRGIAGDSEPKPGSGAKTSRKST